MRYKGILPERKPWVKIVLLLAALYMLYLEIKTEQWIYVPVVLFVILACFFKKEQVISEKGADIEYRLFGFVRHNCWTWEEITTLHTDYRKAKPNVMLHIGKDIVTRTYVMTRSDCKKAIALAAGKNPDIYIEDLSEEEQEKREQEILRRQEVLKAQRRAAKKRKK